MKTKLNTKIKFLFVLGAFALCGAKAQNTTLSGLGTNSWNAGATGTDNTCVGAQAGKSVTAAATYNTLIGTNSGYYISGSGGNTTHDNTFLGWSSGYNTGISDAEYICNYNTFIGSQSGYSNNSGSKNSCLGYKSGYSNSTGVTNTAIGYYAGYANSTSNDNTAIGANCLAHNTAASNSGLGSDCLATNTSGASNMGFGASCLYSNTTGGSNVGMGANCLYSNLVGGSNCAMGGGAMQYTTGNYGCAIGSLALRNATADYNNAIGYGAVINATGTTAISNNGFGANSLNGTTSGGYNNAIGDHAGTSNTTGYYNTYLGHYADAGLGTYSYSTALGYNAVADGTNHMYFGNVNSLTYCHVGLYSGSDGRFKINVAENVKGLAFIKKLRPVTYNMDTKKLDAFICQNLSDSLKAQHQAMDFSVSSAVTHSGFIAQEVEQASHDVGFVNSIVRAPETSSNHYTMNYAELVVPLVKAVQELSQTADSLRAQNQALQAQVNQIINSCCPGATGRSIQNNNNNNGSTNGTEKIGAINVDISDINAVVLNQNVPNPFAEQTVISYNIPQILNSAQILFYNSVGVMIKTVEIKTTGAGQLNVFANDLSNGIYSYTLIVDSKVIDTKRMVKQQ